MGRLGVLGRVEVDDFAEAQPAGRLKIDLGNLRTIGRAQLKDLYSKDHLSRKANEVLSH